MGIVQGLSEFLPISSSAHLVFTSNFYKVMKNIPIVQCSNEEVFFDIMVHLGTLIAVLIFFRKDVAKILKAMWHALRTKDWSDKEYVDYVNTLYDKFKSFSIDEVSFWKGYNTERQAVGFLQMQNGTTGIAKACQRLF